MNTVKNIIKNKNIKVVSFDIFDTLIERPCLYPTDIFSLLNSKKNKINNKDFYDIRIKIEKEIIENGNNNANIYEIYDFLANKYNLSKDKKEYLLNLEIELEYNILTERKIIKELYNLALSENKKIICVSDMYLPSDIIKNILTKNGYKDIDKIYMSCELKKRKDDSSLFKYVLAEEKVASHEMLHIGDNIISDFHTPLALGIIGYHIPSSSNYFFNSKTTKEFASIYSDNDKYSPSERVLLGFFINRFMENKNSIKENILFASQYSIGYNILGPFLFSLCLFIMNNKDIQNNYSCVHFASRDGYLPMKAYDILTENDKNYLKSKYIYCGRRAYDISNYEGDILEYLLKDKENKSYHYKLKDLFIYKIGNEFTDILEKDGFDLDTLYVDDYNNNSTIIKNIINKYSDNIKDILNKKNINARDYYNNAISFNNRRALIFDIGYSGSISNCIGKLTNKKIDKIYVWQTDSNKKIDKSNNTKTYSMYNSMLNLTNINNAVHILFEELLSPLEKSCIGFVKKGKKLFDIRFDDSEIFSNEMKQDLQTIQNACIDFIKDLYYLLGKYKNSFRFITDNLFVKSADYIYNSKTDISIRNFKNICFIDKAFRSETLSLLQKLKYQENCFYKSKFLERNLIVDNIQDSIEIGDKKIAIHIHVFYMHILYEIIDYLKELPIEFDLLISAPTEEVKNQCYVLLNNSILPKSNKVIIKKTINRGRDIAPWLISFKEEQNNYDYVCHIHTKNSIYTDFRYDWRNYLYRNLICKNSIKDIIKLFEYNDNLGIIFPPIYYKLFNTFLNYNRYGMYKTDINNIYMILNKLDIKLYDIESEIIFSAGTMLWYRPNALKKLFDLNLSYDDFEKEPIENSGTLAHAIERLFHFITSDAGYKTLCYLNREEIVDFYFNKIYLEPINVPYVCQLNNNQQIPWFTLFGISNNRDILRIVIFGININIKMTPEKIKKLSRWIPVRKWRDKFRNKFK